MYMWDPPDFPRASKNSPEFSESGLPTKRWVSRWWVCIFRMLRNLAEHGGLKFRRFPKVNLMVCNLASSFATVRIFTGPSTFSQGPMLPMLSKVA